MATSEENKELIETIKRPVRHYRIQLWGYGGESAYLGLTNEQYDYWSKRNEDDDDVLLDYMLDESREEVTDVPLEMDFMGDPTDANGPRYPWYEAPGELEHQYGVDFSSARITITEIDSEDYNASPIEDIVDGEELSEWTDALQAEDNYEIELVSMEVGEWDNPDAPWAAPYILQFHSAEKGTFFEGRITTTGPLNLKKLKFYTIEYANGDDTVVNIEYDGQEIDNDGGDTNGKGYSVHMWKN